MHSDTTKVKQGQGGLDYLILLNMSFIGLTDWYFF